MTRTSGQLAPIAIVDDDVAFREALADLMESFGYRTEQFGSGPDFLTARSQFEPLCSILDVQMPGMTGLEVQAELIRGGLRDNIVFVTSVTEPHLRGRALAAGALGFLNKPFDIEDLLFFIRQAGG